MRLIFFSFFIWFHKKSAKILLFYQQVFKFVFIYLNAISPIFLFHKCTYTEKYYNFLNQKNGEKIKGIIKL